MLFKEVMQISAEVFKSLALALREPDIILQLAYNKRHSILTFNLKQKRINFGSYLDKHCNAMPKIYFTENRTTARTHEMELDKVV